VASTENRLAQGTPWDQSFALKSETSRVAARDDLSEEEVKPMQPLLVRWGRFSMRVPGEAILFLLSKIALFIACLKQ
jgi:hypothetical protein